jgi:hypothetical protein
VRSTPLWLEVGSGRISALKLPDEDELDVASCSPWLDEDGKAQVVGRWERHTGDGVTSVGDAFGLVRCTFPDGEVLNRVPLEVMPVGPPCWYPGTRARVLFPAGDGNLYRLAFEPDRSRGEAAGPDGGSDPRPLPLEWHGRPPAGGEPFLADPCWPDDPRFRHCLLATARVPSTGAAAGCRAERVWWLTLNDAGTAIESAGPLFSPESLARGLEQRCPSVTSLPGGGLALAYLEQRRREAGWRLRMVRLDFDPARGVPAAARAEVRTLADDCLPTPPAFSADGRMLGAVRRSDDGLGRVVRFATGEDVLTATAPAFARPAHGS